MKLSLPVEDKALAAMLINGEATQDLVLLLPLTLTQGSVLIVDSR
jgi:hypothetical protein